MSSSPRPHRGSTLRSVKGCLKRPKRDTNGRSEGTASYSWQQSPSIRIRLRLRGRAFTHVHCHSRLEVPDRPGIESCRADREQLAAFVNDQYLVAQPDLVAGLADELREDVLLVADERLALVVDDDAISGVWEGSVESVTALEPKRKPAIGPKRDDPSRLGVNLLWPPRGGAFDRQRFVGREQRRARTGTELIVSDG